MMRKVAGILALMATVAATGCCRQSRQNVSDARKGCSNIADAIMAYATDVGRVPSETNWFDELTLAWARGPSTQRRKPTDPWGGLFRYRLKDGYFTVESAGPDRTFGTADDIIEKMDVPGQPAADSNPVYSVSVASFEERHAEMGTITTNVAVSPGTVAIATFDGWDADLISTLTRVLTEGGVKVRNVRTGVWSAVHVSPEDATKGREILRKSLPLFSGKVRVQEAD